MRADVRDTINLTLAEISTCYQTECYLASIALSGKIIETLLTDLLASLSGENVESQNLGFHAIRTRLKNYGFHFENAGFREIVEDSSLGA